MTSGFATAPGSSANLGPGFDVLAIAWELRCRATVSPSQGWLIRQSGDEWRPHEGEFVRRAAEAAGPGPFVIEIDNEVPRSRGLGSSSAVATAIAAAAFRAQGIDPSDADLLAIVARMDGHPDNAAAAVFGGLVLVDGLHHVRLELAPNLRFLAAVPDTPLRTDEARAALSASIDRAAVVRSLSRFGFLLRGLQTGDPELLTRARGDELHEAPRFGLSPLTGNLIATALDAGALHACWSGAGPTVLAIAASDEELAEVAAAMEAFLDGAGSVRRLDPAALGWQ
jgi:homoserine kinase